ncbi:MAG: hypothetical protein AAGD10_06930 [Myxococcota bacterium]
MRKGKGKRRGDGKRSREKELRRLVGSGQLEAAEALLRPRLGAEPDPDALRWLGAIEFRRERHAQALDAFGAAFALSPSAELRGLSAQTLLAMGSSAVADREAQAAIAMDDATVQAWIVRARVAEKDQRPEDALDHWRQAHALAPDLSTVWGPLALALADCCAWDEVDELRQRLRRDLEKARRTKRRPAFDPTVALYLGMTPEDVRLVAELWFQTEAIASSSSPSSSRSRPRVAFMSPRLDAHPNGLLLQSVLRALGEHFELTVIDWASREDDVASRIRERAVHHVNLEGRSTQSSLEALCALDLDLLVDLGGFMAGQRLSLLAGRPARRTLHYLGSPNTMGGYVDTRLSAFDWNPPDQDAYFTEPLLRWRGPLVAVDELPAVPASDPPPRPAGSGPLFCNLASGYRLGRRSFERWMAVLQDQPESRLWLARGTKARRAHLRVAAEQAGVDPERIFFDYEGPLTGEYPMRAADAWLDGVEIGAGTSGILCAWAGVPVVTSPGPTPWSRTGAAVVSAAGGEPASDDSAYIRLARSPGPAPRRDASLFDVGVFAQRFGAVLARAARNSG